MFTNIILPIILFGILVFIHELGHFTIAKLSGVFVESFALGFGPALFRKKWGETEYAIRIFPLGGYVKMRGEDPTEDEKTASDPRSFSTKPLRTRMAIVAMGPTSNLLLPILLFTSLFIVGTPVPTSHIGSVIPGYPADKASLRAGDKILSVEGVEVSTWNEMTASLRKRTDQSTILQIEREGKTFPVTLTPVGELEPNMYGENHLVGKIGVDLQPYRPVIGIKNQNGVASKIGLKTGDVVTSADGKQVSFWWEFEEAFRKAKGVKKLAVERLVSEDKFEKKEFELPKKVTSLNAAGIESGELYIREVKPDAIAFEKGLKAEDRLMTLNGEKIDSWYTFRKRIQENKGTPITVGILRKGQLLTIDLIPKEVVQKDEFTKESKKTRQLGVISCAIPSEPQIKIEKYLNPFRALKRGFEETWEVAYTNVVGLFKLFSGKLSLNTLGGPISIFYLAGSSYKIGGWHSFIKMMAILSVTLGILNFLPIPVLDGGHLFFFLIEAVKGSPVQMKIRHIAQQVGLFILVSLMVLVFYVDINRYLVDRIKSLFN